MTDPTRSTIIQLLSNMSDGKEIRAYLNKFADAGETRFAVIKIGGAILDEQLAETAAALAFLHRVGLTPVVLHGGGPQLDAELKARKVETPKIDGLRVTSAEALDAARDVFVGANIKLVEAIRAAGVDAQSLPTGAIEADFVDREKFGFVGEPTQIRLGLLQSIVRSGAIPILTCLGVAPGGQLVNINGDAATRALVAALNPMKIVFLSGTGGLLDGDGQVIHSINLATDFDGLMSSAHVHSGMRLKLQEIARLLNDAPLSTSVSITSPAGLLRELFTHGGDGTLVRRGERIARIEAKAELDPARSRALVEDAFGRELTNDWFDNLAFRKAYVSESYRAGAFIADLDGAAYLDKFAVLEDARGEGLAHAIWRRMADDHPVLYWRSRTKNGFNRFYEERAQGSIKRGPWTIFWTGEGDFAVIGRYAEKVAALPATFVGDE